MAQLSVYAWIVFLLFSSVFTYIFLNWIVLYIVIVVVSFGGIGIRTEWTKKRDVKVLYLTFIFSLIASGVIGFFVRNQGITN